MFGPSTGPHAVLGTVEAVHRTSCSLWSDQGIFLIVEAHGQLPMTADAASKGRPGRPRLRAPSCRNLTPQLERCLSEHRPACRTAASGAIRSGSRPANADS